MPPGSSRDKGADINEPRINERIRVPEVRLVGPAGEQLGIVRIEDALRLAQEADLDLVEVAAESRPPVAKLLDYGKFKYEAAQKAREARRNQSNMVVKEIRFRLKIDDHDYATKKGHVERFLKAGDKVKVTIMFRGREQSRPDAGRRLLQKLAESVAELSVVEHAPVLEGRNMSITLGPLKKKAEARDEARKEREIRVAAEEAEREAAKVAKASKGGKVTPVPVVAAAVTEVDNVDQDVAPIAVAPKAAAPKAVATKAAAPKAAAPKAAAPKAAAAKAAPKAAPKAGPQPPTETSSE